MPKSSSKDSKMPKIIKSSTSTEKPKLETLYSPTKSSPKVIKSHEDSDNSKSKSSSKVSFWGSPDISPGIENILTAMDLNDSSRSLITYMNLCTIRNMIQLSNLDIEDVSNLFSRKDLRDSVFQDTIIKVLCPGKCFQHLTKEKTGLDKNEDIPDHFITDTFKQETDLLDEENMLILKHHYIACYCQLRKTLIRISVRLLMRRKRRTKPILNLRMR
jgi:hypothetical protein